jgi:glycosyltransferase involved in cell wall biosynthesis
MYKIIFFGPVQPNNIKAVGGGEAGNRKTIEILRKLGNTIEIIEKPYLTHGYFNYVFTLLANIFKIIYLRLFKGFNRIHITGYYLNSVYYEFFVVLLSKILFLEVLYEIRAGGFIDAYNNRSSVYRFFARRILYMSKYILCQGMEYVSFIKDKFTIESHYYPNFILNSFVKDNDTSLRKESEIVHLVYFGRVNESKNISFIIEVCSHLKGKINFDLEIIGSATDEYLQFLKKLIEKNGMQEIVKFTPPIDFNTLQGILRQKHFFVFPTKEKREGHSNSLTEAMVFGVVPVTNNNGFNRTVLNNDKLILSYDNPESYSDAIFNIWNSGRWSFYSEFVYKRVVDNYTEQKVTNTLESVL